MAHLFLIAGHGAGDSGAVGYGYTEAERVRALARRIAAYGGSNVTLGDTSRNWYADKGISSLKISKDWQILELHMDSGVSTAKGGHVIIKEGYNPDAYDTALANFIVTFFPGRANKVVGRAHLANVNRAAAKGYSYRLLENGFISNKTDLTKFNNQIDDLARGILKAFGITSAAPVAPVKKKAEPIDGEIKAGGVFQNKTDKFGTISYQAHMRGFGWGNWQSDGLMVGSTGQNRRIEALHIKPDGETDVVVHMKGIGNKEYKNITKDTLIGTTGQNRSWKQSGSPERNLSTCTESTRRVLVGQNGPTTESGLVRPEKDCRWKHWRLRNPCSPSNRTYRAKDGCHQKPQRM